MPIRPRLALPAGIICLLFLTSCAKRVAKVSPLPPPPTVEPVNPSVPRVGPDEIYPNATRNPGAANPNFRQATIAQNICNKNWKTGSIRPPASYTTKLKLQQIVAYGFTVHQTDKDLHYDPATKNIDESLCVPRSDSPRCYEEDHIWSIENAGDPRDPKNLYPEAYNTQVNGEVIGAHQKDAVENYVHNGICLNVPDAKFSSGPKPPEALTLQQAGFILSQDWYACYLKLKKLESCAN